MGKAPGFGEFYTGESLGLTITANKREILPEEIQMEEISLRDLVYLRKMCSKFVGGACPWRAMSYIFIHKGDIVGLLGLSSPMKNLKPRDEFLCLPRTAKEKGVALKGYLEMRVCVGIQPLSWYWNLGKMVALVAPTLGPQYKLKYGDDLKGIITMSLWGRPSQYDRAYKFLGYTAGRGTRHVSQREYWEMVKFLESRGIKYYKSKHGRLNTLRAFSLAVGDKSVNGITFHGQRRGVYFHPAVEYSPQEAINGWHLRWGLPRWKKVSEKTPPYKDNQRTDGIILSNGHLRDHGI